MRPPFRVLIVHERYAYRGGEDQAVDAETALLLKQGHEIRSWIVENKQIAEWSLTRKAQLAWQTTWSREANRTVRTLVREFRPDIVHFHNTLPLISPSALRAARNTSVPVVMTLHNYRLLCPAGTFLREGRICEDCRIHSLARGVIHACYRGSRLQTGAVAVMLALHRRMGTWARSVDAYIVLTQFMRAKMIEGGLDPDIIHVRPNALSEAVRPSREVGNYVLFVGRLSEEKGIMTLLEAVSLAKGLNLRVIGSGPLDPQVRKAEMHSDGRVQVLGQLPHHEVIEIMKRARLLVFPSIWYEGLPTTILEALACGVPVVASRLGAMTEILADGREGFLVAPGDAAALAGAATRVMSDDDLRARMSVAARASFDSRYGPECCYEKLIEIYRTAFKKARSRRAAA